MDRLPQDGVELSWDVKEVHLRSLASLRMATALGAQAGCQREARLAGWLAIALVFQQAQVVDLDVVLLASLLVGNCRLLIVVGTSVIEGWVVAKRIAAMLSCHQVHIQHLRLILVLDSSRMPLIRRALLR